MKTTIQAVIMISLLLLAGCGGVNTLQRGQLSSPDRVVAHQDEITALELYRLLTEYFGDVVIKLSDSKYMLADNRQVAQLCKIRHNPDWDCDDYAIAALVPLRNYAFGAMFVITADGYRHALNIFVNRNREIFFWEPQTNQYYAGQFRKPELILF